MKQTLQMPIFNCPLIFVAILNLSSDPNMISTIIVMTQAAELWDCRHHIICIIFICISRNGIKWWIHEEVHTRGYIKDKLLTPQIDWYYHNFYIATKLTRKVIITIIRIDDVTKWFLDNKNGASYIFHT